jgi:hypothetical protein
MTFVIRDKIFKKDPLQRGNYFDLEPHNYIFNKSTSYTEGKFVVDDVK